MCNFIAIREYVLKKPIKKAKFYCENCGHEVPENAKVCRHCGKFFISIRCPKCGKVGDANTFKDGCPNCGYNMKNDSALAKILQESNSAPKLHSSDGDSDSRDFSLPIWVYIVAGALLIISAFAVFSCIR